MKRFHPLLADEEKILLHSCTEPPGSGTFCHHQGLGVYVCKQCDLPLYLSAHQFSSGCGWPSFDEEIEGNVEQRLDPDGKRTEIVCHRCKGHLGHFFRGELLTPRNARHCVNSLSLRFVSGLAENGFPKAVFAGGCFWGVEELLRSLPGIVSATSGYTGGSVVNPTYEEVCSGLTGHVEAVEIVFDPEKISYESLTKTFLEIHDPFQKDGQGPDRGPQYLSRIFYFSKDQKKRAAKLLETLEQGGKSVATKLLPASVFYPAEEAHQKYYQKTGKSPYCHRRVVRF